MKLVPRFAVGSAVGVAFLVGLFVLLLVSDTLTGSGLILLAAVIGVSVPIGVLLGFLAARRIWLKCIPAGFYRRKPISWWLIPLIVLVSWFAYRPITSVPLPVVSGATLAELGVLAAFPLGMALFERRAGCHLSFVADPSFWSRWVEYRIEPRYSRTAR